MRIVKVLLALAAAAILSQGCGGGGGGAAFTCTSGNCGTSSSSSSSGGTTQGAEEMGTVINGTFQQGVLGTPGLATGTQLSAGGSTQLSLSFIVTKTNAPATDAISVTFTSKCPVGTTTITPATASNTNGSITATYTSAGGCSLTQDTVTATVTGGGTTLTNTTATATIALAQAHANSIVFLSASPTNIGLQGTGQPSSSIVTFQVVTAAGGPVANAVVNFTLSTTLGGVALVNSTATTGTDGKASTTVQAGTRAQSVVVTATTTGPSGPIAANSNSLTVTTGIPDASRVSLSVQCPNVEAYNLDGVTVPVTMRMKDRFSNPVPDGTPVNFAASGGGIGSQCLTTTTPTESGVCTVNWVSQAPRPPPHGGMGAGRVVLLGVAIGEKHFTDKYALGYFVGPPMAYAVDPISPTIMTGSVGVPLSVSSVAPYPYFRPDSTPGDPYLDENESGTYDVGEQYFPINKSSTVRQVDNQADYIGLLCGGPNPTSLPSACGGKANNTQYVGSQALIIMSTGAAALSYAGAPAQLDMRTLTTLSILVSDLNGNAPPAGSTITVTPPTGVTVTPSSFTVGCDSAYWGRGDQGNGFAVNFGVTDSGYAGKSGAFLVTVQSPGQPKLTPPILGVTTGLSVPVLY